uniref:Uncharacterized protein n=1 Tax=Oryza nivara TaxID=4536 RepID=A0A0E0G1R4_ORYNI
MGLRRARAPCPRVGTPQYVSWARSGVYHPCRCAAASTGEEIKERSGALMQRRREGERAGAPPPSPPRWTPAPHRPAWYAPLRFHGDETTSSHARTRAAG